MSEATRPSSATPPPPLTGPSLALGTVALSLATFMNVLDTSIANVSLTAISGDLGVSPSQGTWVITSFAVANAIAVPLTGWLTQRIGPVKLFTASVLLFVLSSWLCGFAPSFEALILFRVIQGAVAGPMIPLSQSLLLSSYPKAKAGTALAMWSMTTLIAPVVGPLLGGWITDHISWPWIFYINVPVGLIAAGATWTIYAKRESPGRKLPIDGVGLGLLVLWVGALQIMLDKGKELDWFHSTLIVGLAFVAVVGFLLFLVWELTDEHPIVDLRLFARRNFTVGVLAVSLGYGVFFGNVVLLPLWLQQTLGYTATQAGLALAPVGLLAIVLSPVVGKRIGTTDPRILATIAFLGFALVLWMRSHFNAQADFTTIMIPTVLQGGAVAFFFIPLVSLTLSGLQPDRIPSATGLSNFARITAGAIGTSLFTTMWDDRGTLHRVELVEHVRLGDATTDAAIAGLTSQGFTRDQALGQLSRLVDQQAMTLSATDIFLLSAVLCLSMIVVVWLARPARNSAGAESAAGAH